MTAKDQINNKDQASEAIIKIMQSPRFGWITKGSRAKSNEKLRYQSIASVGRQETRKNSAIGPCRILHYRLYRLFLKRLLKSVFKGDNPAHHVDAPKVEGKKAKCYDLDQVAAMLKALEKEDLRHQAAIMIALTTGACLGEIMGLEWQDIDFKNKTIEIRQASQFIPEKGIFLKPPKIESSKRKNKVKTGKRLI
ncbi:tyrosine-type recombinase/integrase [Desulfosporosinus sp. FKB]|uniref:tyrosine-type recombinase/integrase n=1 Tax=Desulfosporosinus sp. FKB TaxID=1969835 RepID=UPI00148265C9|nr:tyrosine-type recombinase/integrase [Desulfosporosinus sp. FKB]